ncbi:reverse transcriptase domain-containing protein, partial [Tanacetum coccineum]
AAVPSTYGLAPPSGIPPSRTPPLLPIPLPTSSPHLLLLFVDCKEGVPEVTLMPQKRLCIACDHRYEIEKCSSAPTTRPSGGFRADYCFIGTLDAKIRCDLDREIGYGITNDIDEIYVRLDDAQDDRLVMSDQLNLLCRDRLSHASTARLMESKARASREAWVSIDVIDMERSEVKALQTTTQMVAIQSQQRPARDPTHLDVSEEANTEHEIQRNNNLNGDGSQGSGSAITRPVHSTRGCTYTDFLKCQPMNLKGTKVVVGLTQWFERMETVFNISNCAVENQVKFDTCTLHGVSLTWWKSHVKTVSQDTAHGMPWNRLMKMMTANYTQRFQELALLCERMFPEESDKIEKYVGGLPDMIHGSVMASKPKTMQDAIEFATELIDKKIRTFAERQTQNKRNEKKPYGGSKPLCSKYNYHHDGPCAPKCHKYNRVGHLAHNDRSPANANIANNQRGTRAGRNGNAPAKVHVVGNAGTNPNSNIITGTFLLNNCYAYILFNTGADRSFMSTTFSSQIDITPTTLDYYYDVELADDKIVGINTIIAGCTLNFLNHPFNIDLMPIELGCFDVIIGMGWLAKYQAVIVFLKKIIRIP